MINGPPSRGRERGGPVSFGASSIAMSTSHTPSSNFNHPLGEGRECGGERRDLAATDAPLYFVNVSIDHRAPLGFAPFRYPPLPLPASSSISRCAFHESVCLIADVIAIALSL